MRERQQLWFTEKVPAGDIWIATSYEGQQKNEWLLQLWDPIFLTQVNNFFVFFSLLYFPNISKSKHIQTSIYSLAWTMKIHIPTSSSYAWKKIHTRYEYTSLCCTECLLNKALENYWQSNRKNRYKNTTSFFPGRWISSGEKEELFTVQKTGKFLHHVYHTNQNVFRPLRWTRYPRARVYGN